jgi:hypothetical protein
MNEQLAHSEGALGPQQPRRPDDDQVIIDALEIYGRAIVELLASGKIRRSLVRPEHLALYDNLHPEAPKETPRSPSQS